MNHFGYTISETARALRGQSVLGKKDKRTSAKAEAWFRIVLSAALAVAAVYLIILNQGESQTIGASLFAGLIGYWLR